MMRPGRSRVLAWVERLGQRGTNGKDSLHGLGHEQRAVGETLRNVAAGLQHSRLSGVVMSLVGPRHVRAHGNKQSAKNDERQHLAATRPQGRRHASAESDDCDEQGCRVCRGWEAPTVVLLCSLRRDGQRPRENLGVIACGHRENEAVRSRLCPGGGKPVDAFLGLSRDGTGRGFHHHGGVRDWRVGLELIEIR